MARRTEPKPCPKCGRKPGIIRTIVETFYVVCFDHLETKGCLTEDDAIALWNTEMYVDKSPLPATHQARTFDESVAPRC